jgi:hypothetical protein
MSGLAGFQQVLLNASKRVHAYYHPMIRANRQVRKIILDMDVMATALRLSRMNQLDRNAN